MPIAQRVRQTAQSTIVPQICGQGEQQLLVGAVDHNEPSWSHGKQD